MPPPDQPSQAVLTTLFRHHVWANLKLLDYCERLTAEQLAAEGVAGTYGSIRATLLHIVRGEVDYVQRVNGHLPAEPPVKEPYPSFEVLRQAMRWAGDEFLQLALTAQAGDLVQERGQGVIVEYPVASLLIQAVNHATEHRTQVSALLTQLGLEPPDMTGWLYMEETGVFQERADPDAQPAAG